MKPDNLQSYTLFLKSGIYIHLLFEKLKGIDILLL